MLLKETNAQELEEILKNATDTKLLRNAKDCCIGYIDKVKIDECENSENGQKFTMVRLIIVNEKGKEFKKSYSLEFYRKYINQLGVKSIDLKDTAVIFKKKDRFNNISAFLPLQIDEDGKMSVFTYEDEDENGEDWRKALEKLGI